MASKAFNAYKEIADKVRQETPHTTQGKSIITISSLQPSSKKNGDQIFYMNSRSNEALQFTITANGVLKSAKYIDKDAENKDEKSVFLGKDIEKMQEVVKDPALKQFAAAIDWTKVVAKEDPAQETTAPEAEEEVEK